MGCNVIWCFIKQRSRVQSDGKMGQHQHFICVLTGIPLLQTQRVSGESEFTVQHLHTHRYAYSTC